MSKSSTKKREILEDVVISGEVIPVGTIIDLPNHEIHRFGIKTKKAAPNAQPTNLHAKPK